MKEEIADAWTNQSFGYSKFVQKGLSKRYEREGWQTIFSEELGTKKLKVLDVGTGPGVVALHLADLGHDVTGVDNSDGMLKEAIENCKRFKQSIEFQKGDAESLPFPDNSFDAVVSKFALWTIPHPEKALHEWYRVVKPGGKVVYIDGNWYTDLKNSWFRRRWSDLSKLLILITEFRNPYSHGFEDETRLNLWSSHAIRPSADLEMMKEVGFIDITAKEGLKRRVLSGTRLIKHGYWKDYFLVSGVKGKIDNDL
ncbi:MAG: class I SAM-dependent methyltransferase [Methanomicrobiales archaeon]|nr:class I SAM-dependent methyltransferase [Methanomicrobiales archaeon]